MKLVLASKSPRRSEILTLMRVDFEVVCSDADEKLPAGVLPRDAVCMLAARKAGAVFAGHPEIPRDCFILGADTVVDVDGEMLGKPKDRDDALRMLKLLSGRTHKVHTGICVIRDGVAAGETETTLVRFDRIGAGPAERYVDSGEPFDKAGAYAVQGLGAKFVSGIVGDYFNVMGLPVHALEKLLVRSFGVSLDGLRAD